MFHIIAITTGVFSISAVCVSQELNSIQIYEQNKYVNDVDLELPI